MENFSPPVAGLLLDADPDYKALGLSKTHVPELIVLGTDKARLEDHDRVPSAVIAWRALAYLGAEDAIAPLIALFPLAEEGVQAVFTDLPGTFGGYGAAAIDPLLAYIRDGTQPHMARVVGVNALIAVGEVEEHRETVGAHFADLLENYAKQDNEFNGYVMLGLVKTRHTAAADLIKQAFEAKQVDPFITGDWEKVQVALGLATYEEIRNKERKSGGRPPSLREVIGGGMDEMGLTRKGQRKKKKTKRKKRK
jgi:hypothetical protein